MMELGATVCTPRAPVMPDLSGGRSCVRRAGRWTPRQSQPRQKKREVHYALGLQQTERYFWCSGLGMRRLMAGMWELPEVAAVVPRPGEKQIRRFARNDKSKKKSGKRRKWKRVTRKELNVPLFHGASIRSR